MLLDAGVGPGVTDGAGGAVAVELVVAAVCVADFEAQLKFQSLLFKLFAYRAAIR